MATTLHATGLRPDGEQQRDQPRSPRAWYVVRAVALVFLAGVVAWWTWRALRDPRGWDFWPAYRSGQEAWATGHPERIALWDGTPLLAVLMALTSRLGSLRTAEALLTVLNLVLVLGMAGTVLRRLRSELAPRLQWVIAVALLTFAPMMSTIWWKQFNLIALAAALGGFDLVRKGRRDAGSALIGLSVAIKPLAFLLPIVMLVRKETRRAGLTAIAWVVGLNLAAQAFLATRANDLSVANPITAAQNFVTKTQPGNGWACKTLNFGPGSLLCRLVHHQDWFLQHVLVWLGVALLGLWVIEALRGHRALSWELFAFTLPLSVMLSPLDWAHYEVMLAPLFVLLFVRFSREGAGIGTWAGLAVAFLLASALWMPYSTLPGAIRALGGHHETGEDIQFVDSIAQFGQYVIVITGVLWYAQTARWRTRGRTPPGPELELP